MTNKLWIRRQMKKVILDPACSPGRKGYFLLYLAYFEGMIPALPGNRSGITSGPKEKSSQEYRNAAATDLSALVNELTS